MIVKSKSLLFSDQRRWNKILLFHFNSDIAFWDWQANFKHRIKFVCHKIIFTNLSFASHKIISTNISFLQLKLGAAIVVNVEQWTYWQIICTGAGKVNFPKPPSKVNKFYEYPTFLVIKKILGQWRCPTAIQLSGTGGLIKIVEVMFLSRLRIKFDVAGGLSLPYLWYCQVLLQLLFFSC